MAQTKLRPAPLATGTGLGNLLYSSERNSQNSPSPAFRQAPIDCAAILARRFGMSPPLARVVVELAGMGGANG